VVAGAGARLAAVVIPKVESAQAINEVVAALDAARARADLGIEALIENARGVGFVEQIAAASPRLQALIFGTGDSAA
jgi:citrate lyase subunit beta/citryl-CoA lyase